MPDMLTDWFNTLMNGKTAGLPNMFIILAVAGIIVFAYLYATKKPKIKLFIPKDVSKERKKRWKKEYSYFNEPVNTFLYRPLTKEGEVPVNDKPIAYVIGKSKSPEKIKMERSEPYDFAISNEDIMAKAEEMSLQINNKSYSKLSPKDKKDVFQASKDELQMAKIQSMPKDDSIRYEQGRKLTTYFEWIPLYLFKVCKPDFLSRMFAKYLGIGIEWFPYKSDQITFEDDGEKLKGVRLNADYQIRVFNDSFVFSKEAKDKVADIGFAMEREELLTADANAIPRILAHQEQTAHDLMLKREDWAIEEKRKHRTSETHEM